MPRKNKTKAVQKPAGAEAECCQISGNLHENPIALAGKKMEGMKLYRQTVIDVRNLCKSYVCAFLLLTVIYMYPQELRK